MAFDGKGDNAALSDAAIMDEHAGKRDETGTQVVGQGAHALPDRVYTPLHGIVNGYSQADDGGFVAFKVLEALGPGFDLVRRWRSPFSAEAAQGQWLKLICDGMADVEEAGAPRGTHIFAAGCREEIAADRFHIDGDLTHRLTGIKQVKNPMLPCYLANLSRRI